MMEDLTEPDLVQGLQLLASFMQAIDDRDLETCAGLFADDPVLVALALRTLRVPESTQRLPVDFIGLGMLITWVGALQIMLETSTGKFDPLLLGAFHRCAAQFERIFRELPDSINVD